MDFSLDHFNGIISHFYDFIMPKRTPIEFLRLLNPKKDDRILEIGAGTGRITKHYAEFVHNLTLLDPAEKMLHKALEIIPHAKLVVGVSEDMTCFDDHSFNKIVSYDSFHHWQDQVKGLKETFRVLEPGGSFVLMEVDTRNFWGGKIHLGERILQMNSRMYPPAELTNIMKRVGFKDIAYDPTNHSLTYGLLCKK